MEADTAVSFVTPTYGDFTALAKSDVGKPLTHFLFQ